MLFAITFPKRKVTISKFLYPQQELIYQILMKILPLLPYQQGIHGGTWARVISSFLGLTSSQQTTDRTLVTSFLDNINCIL